MTCLRNGHATQSYKSVTIRPLYTKTDAAHRHGHHWTSRHNETVQVHSRDHSRDTWSYTRQRMSTRLWRDKETAGRNKEILGGDKRQGPQDATEDGDNRAIIASQRYSLKRHPRHTRNPMRKETAQRDTATSLGDRDTNSKGRIGKKTSQNWDRDTGLGHEYGIGKHRTFS